MDDWVQVRYGGKLPMTVLHRRRLPGEVWRISAQGLRALQDEWGPELFALAGDGEGGDPSAPGTGAESGANVVSVMAEIELQPGETLILPDEMLVESAAPGTGAESGVSGEVLVDPAVPGAESGGDAMQIADDRMESLGLSGRIVDVLNDAGVTSVMAMLGMGDDEFLAIGGIGSGSLRQIRERLQYVAVVGETSAALQEMDDE